MNRTPTWGHETVCWAYKGCERVTLHAWECSCGEAAGGFRNAAAARLAARAHEDEEE